MSSDFKEVTYKISITVNFWQPCIGDIFIRDKEQLRFVIDNEYPGIKRNPQFHKLLDDAELHIGLVKKLRKEGFDALRIPVSAPSKEPFPDVFAVKDDTILAFEVKSQARYAYYKRNQVLKLHEFLRIHKYYPKRLAVLAAKFKYKGWTFLIAEKPDFFSLRIGQGLTLSELIKKLG